MLIALCRRHKPQNFLMRQNQDRMNKYLDQRPHHSRRSLLT